MSVPPQKTWKLLYNLYSADVIVSGPAHSVQSWCGQVMGVATYPGRVRERGIPPAQPGGMGERCKPPHQGLGRSPRSKRFIALEKLRKLRKKSGVQEAFKMVPNGNDYNQPNCLAIY